MTTVSLTSPPSIGTRTLVRSWLEAKLDSNLEGVFVEVDCAPLRSPSPSFVDELVKFVVLERHAARLTFLQASTRTADLARKAATNRKVTNRVEIQPASRSLLHRLRA